MSGFSAQSTKILKPKDKPNQDLNCRFWQRIHFQAHTACRPYSVQCDSQIVVPAILLANIQGLLSGPTNCLYYLQCCAFYLETENIPCIKSLLCFQTLTSTLISRMRVQDIMWLGQGHRYNLPFQKSIVPFTITLIIWVKSIIFI